ncbi:MAG: transposase [Bacteroidetes bacterium]|nr:MAG: transposase [Bacteroidota bacterium]
MKFQLDQLFHVYNQGNNREQIFLERADYILFLTTFRKLVMPYCDILAYCLMPNHFHFLLYISEKSLKKIMLGNIEIDSLSNGFRKLLSEYAFIFNKKNGRTGSLFRQKTQKKCLSDGKQNYVFTCFHYIHQNPLKAGLINKMEDWEFSSFRDYTKLRNGTLCNQNLTNLFVEIDESFYDTSYQIINEELSEKLYLKTNKIV